MRVVCPLLALRSRGEHGDAFDVPEMLIRVDGAEVWDGVRGEQIRMFTFLLDRLSQDRLVLQRQFAQMAAKSGQRELDSA